MYVVFVDNEVWESMNVGFVIGSLGRGGAELQLVQLATGLHERGHSVSVIAYDAPGQLDEAVRAAGVTFVAERADTRMAKVRLVRAWMRASRINVVHAFLSRPSVVALAARMPARRPAVVVTDFSSATYQAHIPSARLVLGLYALADAVVTETETNHDSLKRVAPWLRRKIHVVRNGLDLHRFSPTEKGPSVSVPPFVFCVVGTVSAVKNPFGVIAALATLRGRQVPPFRVDWYGRSDVGGGVDFEDVRAAVAAANLSDVITFRGDISNIEAAYRGSHALLHASVREGFPNAVAEAMACGLPIVVSRVSDLPLAVELAANGLVFDEKKPSAIADAMERMLRMRDDERRLMGRRSRELAERWFARDLFLDKYEALYAKLAVVADRGE